MVDRVVQGLLGALIVIISAGCGQSDETVSANNSVSKPQAAQESERPLPPGGFLDDDTPAPQSDTVILSGGVFIRDGEELTDSVVVITGDKLVAWGKRGTVDIPNDSLGYDMTRKWIIAGQQTQDGSLKLMPPIEAGAEANLLLFKEPPSPASSLSALAGYFSQGTLTVFDKDDG